MRPDTITILGDGQMGLVCAAVLADQPPAPRIRIWGIDKGETQALQTSRRSPRLDGFELPRAVEVTSDEAEALAGARMIISAVPTQFMRSAWERFKPHAPEGAGVVSVSKGVENRTMLRPTQIVADVLKDARPVATLSGPTIAAELAARLPATMVAACDDHAFAQQVQEAFNPPYLRVYSSDDPAGVELAGALKNVIAIAAGIIDGLELGANAKSALLARGLAEIARLGVAMGAQQETFFGVAGVGDLATTCFSPHGRNRSCGEALGRGESLDDYLARTTSVVEGVATCRSVRELAKKQSVEMPIAAAVHAVLFEGLTPKEGIRTLMDRPLKRERVG